MKAEVRKHNGTPTLYLDDRPVFAGIMCGIDPRSEPFSGAQAVQCYAGAGVHIYTFDVGAVAEWCGPGPGRPGDVDLSLVEGPYRAVLEADPEALFILRVHLELQRPRSDWWLDRYPEECELTSDGERLTQSFASPVWREQAKGFLRQYIAQLGAVGLADRVIGYKTGAGHTGEWVKGSTSMRSPCGDYGPAMAGHFRQWLRQRYGREVSRLRSAWADAAVTFETACVPAAAAQLTTTHQSFRDPAHEQAVIDYYRCLAELCGDLVVDFNRAVKEATGGQALAGAFFGYLMELAWNSGFFAEGPDSDYSTYQRSGHLGLARVLRAPEVDFLVSPYAYGFRGVGGHGVSMPPSESMRVHGKLYIMEEDSRTHLTPPEDGYGRAESLDESVALLQRNFAEVLTRGQGAWWCAGSTNVDPVREPAFAPLLRRFQELGDWAQCLDRRPSAEIAVFVDDESLLYQSVRNDLDVPLIFQQRLWGLPRLGAPADYYLLQDLAEGRLKPYKLYVFLNAFRLDRARREALKQELRRDGRVALWIYASGYIEERPALENMTDLTGFRFYAGEHAWGPTVHIVDYAHPITRELSQDLFWGTNGRIAPVFHVADPEARVLGHVVYAQGRCRPGLAVKEHAGWTSVYSAAPNLPPAVLRGIARHAGVHVYSSAGDVVYASPNLLSVHTVAGGERQLALPETADVVYDLFARRQVARRASAFQAVLPPRSTTLYYTGPEALLPHLG
jgi:hypothetical protein